MSTRNLPSPLFTILIALIAIVILVRMLASPGPSTLSEWPGNRSASAPLQSVAGPARVQNGTIVMQLDPGLYAGQESQIESDLQIALTTVVQRFGSPPQAPITVHFSAEAGCSLNGIAYTDVREVRVYTCNDIAPARAIAILAHELVHQLAQDRYGPAHLQADLILSEGMPTWAAGSYWLGGQPDFRTYVRQQRANGISLPLATHYSGRSVSDMNTLYYQWASFVEYLINNYGRDQFDNLYVSGGGSPGAADYRGVYGQDLAALERDWERWVDGR